MKQFKQRMVNNMIRDLQKDIEDEKHRWDNVFKVYVEFDNEMILENFEQISKFKGQKSLYTIGETIKFLLITQNYLRTQLQLALVDDLEVVEKADLHNQMWQYHKEMVRIDPGRTQQVKNKFRQITKFKKIDENQYEVNPWLLNKWKINH